FRDGWLLTGDMGYLDDDGYLFVVERKKDLLIRGGFNVYPKDVEEVIYRHPAVSEAAVVGVPDSLMGEEVCAYVVKKDGADVTKATIQREKRKKRKKLEDATRDPNGVVIREEASAMLRLHVHRPDFSRSFSRLLTRPGPRGRRVHERAQQEPVR